MLCFAITVIAFTSACTSSSTSVAGASAGASPAPGSAASSSPAPANGTTNPCAYPDALRSAGLLSDAEAEYQKLLVAQYPDSATPGAANVSATPNAAVIACATRGLRSVETASQEAIGLAAEGDQAAADGQPSAAAGDYSSALGIDRSNTAAASGLQKVDQEQPDGIRDASDWWSQFVSNTLVPLGQFLLWALAAIVVLYILRLLARIAAQGRWLTMLPSRPGRMKTAMWVSFLLAAAAAGGAAYVGTSAGTSGGLWLGLLGAAAALVVLGYALLALVLALDLRSGTGLQVSVTNKGGDPDKAACAYLVGRLKDLGVEPPRGFDMPQSPDVTGLDGALAVLPGGGTLSSLIDFLLERVPATPWVADVTLIDDDQLLVTLHHNRQLVPTELANRNSLLFPLPVPGQDDDGPSADVTDIDPNGLLTIAAAVILVGMSADPHSPLKPGLNGASRWESVAG